MLLQDAIAQQAEATPDARAIVHDGAAVTYAELESTANRLGHALIRAGCRSQDRVAILMPKRPEAIAAMLAALKADCSYVPLDPGDPPARIARTLEIADCRCLLAAGSVGPLLGRALEEENLRGRPAIGWLDGDEAPAAEVEAQFTKADVDAEAAAPPPSFGDPDRLAQILFTSGSTGTPKGVMISHANVLHFVDWASAYFGLRASDRISQHSSLRFDISNFDVFGALGAGAELHLVPRELNVLPHKLAEFIREQRLTQWFSVPSVLNLMAKFDVIRHEDFPELRRVLFAGEVLPTPTLIYWMRRLPHVQFTNLYGPTETTISSSYYTVPAVPDDADQSIPIGVACEGEELLLLDDDLKPVTEPDVEADLYILGEGVTPGYWRDQEKTRRVFLEREPDGRRMYRTGDRARRDADGLYYFIGRADTQIKSRGYRIELGEIEAALHGIEELRECAVVAVDSADFGGAVICCAYAAAPETKLTQKELREGLARKLPSYMLPARWRRYALLPKNSNGKLDRPLIIEHFRAQEVARAPLPTRRAATDGQWEVEQYG